MRDDLRGILRLTRCREYIWFVVVTTSLGVIAAYGPVDWRLAVILLANELAVGFAFMINDVEDAADDALDPNKCRRNPVSASLLTPRTAYAASLAVAILSAMLFALLGRGPFLVGAATLAIAFLYSWRPVRLKAIPFVDLISHALMLAGLQFIASYVTFGAAFGPRFYWPLAMVLAISAYGELYNELRDLEGDERAGVTHTASWLGADMARRLATGCALGGVGAGFGSLFFVQLVPLWVIGLLALAAAVLLARPVWLLQRQGGLSRKTTFVAAQAPLHKPVEIAAAFALSMRVIGPWLNTLTHTMTTALLQTPLGVLLTSSPWSQQLQRIWQLQTEQLLRLF